MDPFAGRRLSTLTESDLATLIEAAVPEGQHIEYKRDLGELLSPNRDRARKARQRFLANVTAFANAEGGLLLVGVEEDRDGDGQPLGTPTDCPGIDVPNADALKQLIGHLMSDGIDERIPGLTEIEVLGLAGGNHVVAIRVPASIRGPHMVILDGMRQFFIRTGNGKQPMSTAQIRDLAVQSETMIERAEQLITARTAALNDEAEGKAYWAVHWVPLIRQRYGIDLTDPELIRRLRELAPLGASGWNHVHCTEGFMTYNVEAGGLRSHSLISREGWVELYDDTSLNSDDEGSRIAWPFASAERDLFAAVEVVCGLHRAGLISFPAILGLRLENLHRHYMPAARITHEPRTLPIGTVAPPPLVVTELPTDVKRLCKPLLDVIWNAAGHRCCPGYNEAGDYVGYR